MSENVPVLYEFGSFRLDTAKSELVCDGQIVTIVPKAIELLSVLIRHRNQTMNREQLLALLWPGIHVTAANLTQTIYLLRRTLCKNGNDQTYIETVPRRGYRFVAEVRQTESESINSMAVLPFKVISADAEDYPLGLGMTDVLITKLSLLRQLIVRPTSAVFRYVNQQFDPLAIGKELKVETVLDGTVQRARERVRLSLRLVRVSDGRVLWAEIFDEPFGGVFAAQDAIAEQVASLLSRSLNSTERQQLARRHTDNFNAYQSYIRGLYFWGKRTKEGLEKSIKYFTEAIREEPDYALAHAGLADSYALAGVFLYDFLPADTAFENARAEALRAIELDETLPQAHAALFLVKHNYDEDAEGAEREIRRAIELNPHYATAHLRYAFFHRDYGNLHQALAEVTYAQQLDPLSMMNNYLLSEILYLTGQMEQAAAYCEKAFETDPEVELLRLQMAYLYTQKNMYEEAISILEEIPEDQPFYVIQKLGELGYAFAAAGHRSKAFAALSALKALEHEPLSNYCMALIYTGLDEKELALRHLEAETARYIWLRPYYSYEPRLSSLRADMRFASVLNTLSAGYQVRIP